MVFSLLVISSDFSLDLARVYSTFKYVAGRDDIDSNLEHLLASNFTESLFWKCSNTYKILHDISDVYFRQILSKISGKKVLFLK